MRISFDLDDVLFVSPETYETEPAPRFPYNRLFPDRLRKGTPQLIHALQKKGFEVWIYTSSYRTEMYLKALFRAYGIRFDGIVNGQRHESEVQRDRKERLPQKLPNFYRISLHIDDEKRVAEHGRQYGFRTFRVFEPDEQWAEKVLAEAERVERLEQAEHP
ncbi:MAG: HAD family hydrolase [Oscillospiraceae bacterium]|nr:HAD family hydrolase [Oscillospiraceae bacterium]